MPGIFEYFKFVLMMHLFFSFAITGVTHTLPDQEKNYVSMFSTQAAEVDMGDIGQDIESSIQSEANLPLLDVGALVYHSGNLLLDLLVNFLFAIPAMITLLLSGFFLVFSVDAYIATQIKLLIYTLGALLYLLGVLVFIMNIRAGGGAIY